MKITKEEVHLYKFLKTAFDIQKSANQKYIIGNYGFLYFYTPFRCGKFYQKSEDRIAMEYNFNDYASYTLSLLPDGDFELRENDYLSKDQMIDYMGTINDCIDNASFIYDFDKDDECQLAKMTSLTDLMLCDSDIKYFNRFKDTKVFTTLKTRIVADSDIVEDDLNIHVTLIFDTNGHDVERMVQTDLFGKRIQTHDEIEEGEIPIEVDLDDIVNPIEDELLEDQEDTLIEDENEADPFSTESNF